MFFFKESDTDSLVFFVYFVSQIKIKILLVKFEKEILQQGIMKNALNQGLYRQIK